MEERKKKMTVKEMRDIFNRLIGAGLANAEVRINYCPLSELEEIRIQAEKEGGVTVLMSIQET